MVTQTLQQRLCEAETAYHSLLLGKSVVQFRDANGETLTYTVANRTALAAYIDDLKRQINNSGHGPLWVMI